jgi:hypothetical protein
MWRPKFAAPEARRNCGDCPATQWSFWEEKDRLPGVCGSFEMRKDGSRSGRGWNLGQGGGPMSCCRCVAFDMTRLDASVGEYCGSSDGRFVDGAQST